MRRRIAVGILIVAVVVLMPTAAGALPSPIGIGLNPAVSMMSYAFRETANGLVGWVMESVGNFTQGIVNFLETSASPEVDSVWFSGSSSPYAAVRSIALMTLLVFVFLGIISGLLRGDVEGMLRRIAGNLPAALFGMVVTTFAVSTLLQLTDSLSAAVLQHSGGNALTFLKDFTHLAVATNNSFAVLLLGFVAVVSGMILWVELLIRSALIYFLVALSPLAFAATLWPATRSVLRRLSELLLAAILSKFVICVALSIGAAALGGVGHAAPSGAGIGTEAAMGLGSLLSGAVILLLACWSPFLLLRMLPILEGAVVAQGVSRAPMRTTTTAMSTVSSAGSVSRLAGVSATSAKPQATPRLVGGQARPAYATSSPGRTQ